MFEVLAEHGVTSRVIPLHYQSPLYCESEYYQVNLRTQRWLARSSLFLCIARVYNWSLANQVESEVRRTLPDDMSGLARFLSHCCLHVDGSAVDNGIARHIITYFGGFDDRAGKMIGMPAYGKNDYSLPRCEFCDKEYSEVNGGLKHCCGNVYYCYCRACRRRDLRNHEASCVCPIARKLREAEGGGVMMVREEMKKKKKANDEAVEAATANLAKFLV
jgi:hypothetical protein